MPEDPTALLVAALLAAAVGLVLPEPPGGPRRLRTGAGRPWWLARWEGFARPVPGAPATETRARIAMTAGGLAGVVVLGLAPGGGLLAPLLVGASAAAGYLVSGRIVSPATVRRRRRLAADLPGALELMASCLAAGLPVRGAAAAVAGAYGGPLADDVGGVLAQIAIGDSEGHAWLRLADDPVWTLVARDLARSVQSGSTLVDLLRRHAERARKERHGAIVEAARTVGVRSVLPLMGCYLPAFLLVGIVPVVAGTLPRLLG
ncbi:type II secretion system F family protein [Raineyella sp. LH-20]|uniref:type II secretion system F family protein n=1 Tax=Raineyella sp. LH-20 TaxID=3081204 RepID=UPI0029558F7F|nr:type II secretion system F family protein [Raineyella sp. LH-20]WOP19071.1 type II secretion system F family protein [Raineyella sp. LH-20]